MPDGGRRIASRCVSYKLRNGTLPTANGKLKSQANQKGDSMGYSELVFIEVSHASRETLSFDD